MTATTARRVIVVSALSLLIVLAIPLALRARGGAKVTTAIERFEAEVGPLNFARYQPPAIDRRENAGVWLKAAAQAIVLSKEDMKLLRTLSDAPEETWQPDQRQQLDLLVADAAPALELLARSIRLERSNFELDYSKGDQMQIPNFLSFITANRLVGVKGRRDLAKGDLEGFEQAVLMCSRSARTLEGESIVISQLVGLAVERGCLALLHEGIVKGVDDIDVLRRLKAAIGGVDLQDMIARSLGAEGTVLVARGGQSVSKLMSTTHSSGASSMSFPSLRAYDRRWVARAIDNYRQIAADLGRPFAEVHAEYGKPTPILATDKIESQLAANFDQTVHRAKTIEGMRHLAEAALNLRIQAVEDIEYPTRITGATPNPYTGQQLSYEVLADGSAVLSATGAAELHFKIDPERNHRAAPLFSWELPAPTN